MREVKSDDVSMFDGLMNNFNEGEAGKSSDKILFLNESNK